MPCRTGPEVMADSWLTLPPELDQNHLPELVRDLADAGQGKASATTRAGTLGWAAKCSSNAHSQSVVAVEPPPGSCIVPADASRQRGSLAVGVRVSIPFMHRTNPSCTSQIFDPDYAACKLSAPSWTPLAEPPPPPHALDVGECDHGSERILRVSRFRRTHGTVFITKQPYPTDLGIAGVPTIWIVTCGVLTQIIEGAHATSARNVDVNKTSCRP